MSILDKIKESFYKCFGCVFCVICRKPMRNPHTTFKTLSNGRPLEGVEVHLCQECFESRE